MKYEQERVRIPDNENWYLDRTKDIYSLGFSNGLFLRIDQKDNERAEEVMQYLKNMHTINERKFRRSFRFKWERFWYLRRHKKR